MPEDPFGKAPGERTLGEVAAYLVSPLWGRETIRAAQVLALAAPGIADAAAALDSTPLTADEREELEVYVAAKVPRLYADYWLSLAAAMAAAGVGVGQSGQVAQVVDSIRGVTTVIQGKALVDRLISEKLGISAYRGLFSLTASLPLLSQLPVPPARLRVPETVAVETHWALVDFETADVATIAPRDNIVLGPLLQMRRGGSFEVSAAPTGKDGALVLVLWALWEQTGCIYFRFWIPIAFAILPIQPANSAMVRFSLAPDYAVVTAHRIQPLAYNTSGISVRRIL